ncbi:hypothetical protein GJA_1682 [Janthinobacterium agaricidamnosum NBRC 102515 = DSM 9628]|uniref:Uncharacterized protein n=1 Tax=Janthinobacterium agaricidamnosum NBRC 102515 = DSM 9628 TaxID=1349767 RepID=W0V3Y1_9BURK|nr:hypothetical protein GJA_1682 [Janthinobacterium agaricidamnosum NBRC 102515 = DSM 9628]
MAPHAAPLSGRLEGQADKDRSKVGRVLGKRQFALSSRAVGLGRVRIAELPHKTGLPARIDDRQTLHASARALAQRVERIMDTTLEELPEINARPGRSALVEKLSGYWPASMFIPKKVSELLAEDVVVTNYSLKKVTQKIVFKKKIILNKQKTVFKQEIDKAAGAVPRDTRPQRRDFLDQIAAGMAQLTQVEREYIAARDAVSSQGETPSSVSVDKLNDAQLRLQEAVDTLHASVTLTTMLGSHDNALATDLLRRKTDFVKVQVEICQEKLRKTGLDLDQQRGLLNQQRDGLQQAVALADLAVADAERGQFTMETLLIWMQEQLVLDQAPQPADARHDQERASRIAETGQQIAQLQPVISAARQQLAACERERSQAQEALDQFAPVYTEQMTQLYAQRRKVVGEQEQLSKSAAALPARAEAWQQRAGDTYALQHEQHQQAIDALVRTAPGFAPQKLLASADAHAQLQTALRQVAEALPEDDVQAERSLPRMAVVEIISRSVASAAGGDAQRGADLLRELLSRPSEQWLVPPPKEGVPALVHAPPSDDLRTLFRNMASVPRGIELLDQVAAGKTGTTMNRPQLEALHLYWIADQAQARESSDDVKAWLESAKSVACHAVRNSDKDAPLFDIEALPLEQKIAFRAVGKGLLSNAPGSDFDRINQTLLKFGGEWVDLPKDERGKLMRQLPRSPLNPASTRTTPFAPKVLRLGIKQLEAQGMPSVKSDADKKISELTRKLTGILQQAPLSKGRPATAGDAEFEVMAKVVCDYMLGQHAGQEDSAELATPRLKTDFHKSKRLYKTRLGPLDVEQIRRESAARLRHLRDPGQPQADGQRKLIKPNPAAQPLPAPFDQLFGKEGALPGEVVRTLVGHLDSHLSAAQKTQLGWDDLQLAAQLDKMDHAVAAAGRKRFNSKAEIHDFYAPMLEQLRLRNQLTMTSGGEVGVGIPMLPWAPVAPLIANVNMTLFSKKQEAAFALKSPTYGVEFIMSDIVTKGADIKGTVGFGLDLGFYKLTLPAFSLKGEANNTHTDYAVLRGLRGKDKSGVREEQAARDDSLALLDTLINWDADGKHPEPGQVFQGPLEAILALHPAVEVGWGSKDGRNRQVTADLAAAIRVPLGIDRLSAGVGLNINAKADGSTERTVEHSSFAHRELHDQFDQRRQRMAAGVVLGGSGTSYKQALTHDDGGLDGSIRIPAPFSLADLSRELAYNLERNGVTTFSIGDKAGASADRVYGRAETLLAEIEANMEEFYLRFLEALPVEPGAVRDTPENRALAESTLRQFMADLKTAASRPNLQFNLKYELQPRMSGWVDGLRAMEAIAAHNGDLDAVQEYRQAAIQLMQFRSSWAFKNCAIRSKGKAGDDRGWDFLVRLMSRSSAESSVALNAYPA